MPDENDARRVDHFEPPTPPRAGWREWAALAWLTVAELASAVLDEIKARRRWDVLAMLLGAALTLFLATCALADPLMHRADDPAHWYDRECCDLRDCQPVPDFTVEPIPGGYRVTLTSEDHSLVHPGQVVTKDFRHPNTPADGRREYRWSQDMDHHACVTPTANSFLCLYVPPPGV